jgi:hypothetical protein
MIPNRIVDPFVRTLTYRTLAAVFFGWFAAALVPAACIAAVLLYRVPELTAQDWRILLSMAFVFAGGYALILGVPITMFLRAKGWLHALPMLAVGFMLGAVPLAVQTFPTMLDGVSQPTWTQWWQGVLQFGLLGALSAIAFYGTFRAIDRDVVGSRS